MSPFSQMNIKTHQDSQIGIKASGKRILINQYTCICPSWKPELVLCCDSWCKKGGEGERNKVCAWGGQQLRFVPMFFSWLKLYITSECKKLSDWRQSHAKGKHDWILHDIHYTVFIVFLYLHDLFWVSVIRANDNKVNSLINTVKKQEKETKENEFRQCDVRR